MATPNQNTVRLQPNDMLLVAENALLRATIRRIFIAGLTTEYCVLNSAWRTLKLGYEVFVPADAIRAANIQSGNGDRAVEEMKERGAKIISVESIGP